MKLPTLRRNDPARDALVAKASREAESGRRLAMFDRQIGLYAYWYLVRRFEEEARRAERYARPLTAMIIEVMRDENHETLGELTAWLEQELRGTDLACHLGAGRFLIVLTETSLADGAAIAARMADRFPRTLAIGLGSFPEDGAQLDEVKKAAERRAHGNWALAV
jgi:GGDEF domain-containing protein